MLNITPRRAVWIVCLPSSIAGLVHSCAKELVALDVLPGPKRPEPVAASQLSPPVGERPDLFPSMSWDGAFSNDASGSAGPGGR